MLGYVNTPIFLGFPHYQRHYTSKIIKESIINTSNKSNSKCGWELVTHVYG